MTEDTLKLTKISKAKGALGGFTLVEVLVTVAVLTYGCLVALHMQTHALRGNLRADHMTVATFLAESKTEYLKAFKFEDLTSEIAKTSTPAPERYNRYLQVCPSTDASLCTAYPYTLTTKYYPNYPTTYSHHAEVEVAWKDNTGTHSLIHSTSITDLSM
jgi:Tfp pilus assembly protein PilV